ncbi:unnamed protein product [Coffea canephora]|uniref:Uncharacterized protein n=1 Tax=Coffea canephora TaxID=49390 RepID=A0A068TSR0_COFCA|nr:unnamed protein product [Coffea canephora]
MQNSVYDCYASFPINPKSMEVHSPQSPNFPFDEKRGLYHGVVEQWLYRFIRCGIPLQIKFHAEDLRVWKRGKGINHTGTRKRDSVPSRTKWNLGTLQPLLCRRILC